MLNIYQLEQHIEEQMQAAQVPGLALAIVKDQAVIYARGFGVTSVEDSGVPVTPQTLFRIASVTRPLTGTALMRLVEQGKLDLDRPLKHYIDWLTFHEAGIEEQVSLRMLLSHTSGLRTAGEHFGPRNPEALEAYIRTALPTFELTAPPGKFWAYSNPGMNLAGYLAEVVSGQPFTRLMQELVFDPLQMRRTTFDPLVAMTYALAQSHDVRADGTLCVQHEFAESVPYYPSSFALSTVLDLANFASMQMNHGAFQNQQVLTPASVQAMQTKQVSTYTLSDAGYGLTLGLDTYKGIPIVEHKGSISTFGSRFVLALDERVAIVLLYNRINAAFAVDHLISTMLDQVLDLPAKFPGPQAIEPDTTVWPLYTGSYLGNWRGLLTISAQNAQLYLDMNGKTLPLHALKRDLYFGKIPESEARLSIGFPLEGPEPADYILVDTLPCQRIERASGIVPDLDQWQAYCGTYVGGVDVLTFRIEDGQLIIHASSDQKEVTCIPLDTTRFACDWGVFEFHIAQDGSVPWVTYGQAYKIMRVDA
ncbi:MAG: beta-lactamase family protein [Chloroflexota bacterium]|nr:beta-lactamase family protein [Chloroflexota bacterium]